MAFRRELKAKLFGISKEEYSLKILIINEMSLLLKYFSELYWRQKYCITKAPISPSPASKMT